MYLPCYALVLRNKYTDEITYIYTSDLRGDIINLQMDAMDITWILMAPCSKWGYENIRHRQSIGKYFLILAHMEVFSELSAGCIHSVQIFFYKWKSDFHIKHKSVQIATAVGSLHPAGMTSYFFLYLQYMMLIDVSEYEIIIV